jgi:unsaturated rhamnogalacturonyl hydrolase
MGLRVLIGSVIVVTASCGCVGKITSISSSLPWSHRIAESFVRRHPDFVTYDSLSPDKKWNYEQGLMLVALHEMSIHSGDSKYAEFVYQNLDRYVGNDGSIKTYKRTDYNIDNIGPGRPLLLIFEKTGAAKFKWAADTLRQQLRDHPRTNEGGFWHKKIYPYQMWLDGLFMAQPFYAQYAKTFGETEVFADVANQFLWIASHTFDKKSGLYYHGWDESRQQRWANPETGCSPHFWGRALGWYMMAIVDVMDYMPADHPRRESILGIFRNLAASLLRYRDAETSLWYQVVDQGTREGNYLEASASLMFAFSLAKGANRGYLDESYLARAEETFNGATRVLVTVTGDGFVDLHKTCRGAGLGGNPYRDGSFEYYIGEPVRTNDMKGYGPFLRAAIEIERGKESKRDKP